MKVQQPLCPKCGCPPRNVIGVFKVRVGVVAQSGGLTMTGEKRVMKPVGEHPLTLECGGGHQWETAER